MKKTEPFHEIERQLLAEGCGVRVQAHLKNADHLPVFQQRMLVEAFENELFGRFGTAGAMYLAHAALNVGRPSTWLADFKSAYRVIESTLSAADAEKLALGREGGVQFEVEFIHDQR